jgi:AraC-like DNA-binding protein
LDTHAQIHRFGEVKEIRRVVRRFGFDVNYMRLTPGPLDSEAIEIQVDGCLVYRERFGFQVLASGTSSPRGFTIMAVREGLARFFDQKVSTKQIVLYPPGCSIDAVGYPGFSDVHYLLPADRIAAAAANFGVDLIEAPRAFVMDPGIDRLDHLSTVLAQIDAIVENRDLTIWPRVERELVTTFLGLFDAASHDQGWSLPPLSAASKYATETRKYICSKSIADLDVASLARELGITRQHLNRCFRQYYGVSVHEFVHLCRLHQARELLQGGGPEMNVTEAAYSSGFNHLGRFSSEYKRLFGESPSQTLQQAVRSSDDR